MQGPMHNQMAEERDRTIANVVSEYGKRLFAFIRKRVPTNADAEDILQDVWFQLSRVVDLDALEQVSGWLYRVARNRVTDSYRKQKPQLLEDMDAGDEEGMSGFIEMLLADHNTPETETLRQIFWETLFAALEELPPAQRDVFVWNELDDRTFQEIANETGENIKTLISRKRYAVQHLRQRLQHLYDEVINYE
jgi:RNA polymerase sigma factor (sigma-70 family)